MPEKAPKKTVAIKIKRERLSVPKTIVAEGFRLRPDKGTGLMDVLLEGTGSRGERVILDPELTRSNLDILKQYAAGVAEDPDDSAEREDITVGEAPTCANIVHFSRMGNRAETIFGIFCLADWVEATRQTNEKAVEIKALDVLVVMSTAAFQKKLVQDLIISINQQGAV